MYLRAFRLTSSSIRQSSNFFSSVIGSPKIPLDISRSLTLRKENTELSTYKFWRFLEWENSPNLKSLIATGQRCEDFITQSCYNIQKIERWAIFGRQKYVDSWELLRIVENSSYLNALLQSPTGYKYIMIVTYDDRDLLYDLD